MNGSEASRIVTLFKEFGSLFSRFRGSGGGLEEQVKSGLLKPQQVQDEIKLLMIEGEIMRTTLRLIERAVEDGILDKEEKEGLSSKYLPTLNTIYQDLSRKRRVLQLLELEYAKKGLEEYYSRRLSSIEKRIRDIGDSLASEPFEPPLHLGEEGVGVESSSKASADTPIPGLDTPISSLKDEVRRALERLEQIEVEA